MTVHDKVEVTIHRPQGAFQPQVPPSRLQTLHCLCTHLRDVLFKSWFLSPVFTPQRRPILFSPSLCYSSQGGTSKDTRRHCLPLFIPTRTHFLPFSSVCPMLMFFKGGTLGETVNRCGTGSTCARLSRAKVMTSYVSSPDVLLTAIDFHLFIFTLRIPLHFF